MPGTSSLVRQGYSGVHVAAIFNCRDNSSLANMIVSSIWQLLGDGRLDQIPLVDPFALPADSPALQMSAEPLSVSLPTQSYRYYELLRSDDLHTWVPWGTPWVGDGSTTSVPVDPAGAAHSWWRVRVK